MELASNYNDRVKCYINTGHLTFDRQSNYIGQGNVFAPTQRSSYIRAKNNTTNPVGQMVPEGHLRDWDLKNYFGDLPNAVRMTVLKQTEDKPIILYEFFHRNGQRKITHGYILTTADHQHIQTYKYGPTNKSWSVLHKVKEKLLAAEKVA